MGKKARAKKERREREASGAPPRQVLVDSGPETRVSAAPPSKPVNVSDASFEREVIESELPVLVDFWASWCGPCKMIAPILEQLADELQGQLKIAKIDTERNRRIPEMLNVRSIPTLVLFKDGDIVDIQVGAVPKARLEAWLHKHLTPKRSLKERLFGTNEA